MAARAKILLSAFESAEEGKAFAPTVFDQIVSHQSEEAASDTDDTEGNAGPGQAPDLPAPAEPVESP